MTTGMLQKLGHLMNGALFVFIVNLVKSLYHR